MKRLLLAIGIFIALFILCPKVQAQNQTVTSGSPTTGITMPGTGCTYNWVNDTPGIGLAASGTGDITSFTAVNNGSSATTATITATPVAGGFAYIANQGDGTVSVINTSTNVVVATVTVGSGPCGIAVNTNNGTVYVTNAGDNTVSVIDMATNTQSSTIPVGSSPGYITISPDGSKVYVSNYYGNSVSVISTATNAVVGTIPVGTSPYGLAVSPDGSKLYVANAGANSIFVIDTINNTLLSTINIYSPIGLSLSPDGSKLYAANNNPNSVNNSGSICVINTGTNAIISTIAAGIDPRGVSISPDGSRLYIANYNSNTVSVINTSNNSLINTIQVGSFPWGISVSPDGTQVYVVNYDSKSVSVINTATNMVVSTIAVGFLPFSFGYFVSGGAGCVPAKFAITVNPSPATSPTITAGAALGNISACVGAASASSQVQQIAVSGNNLITDITVTAPNNFEVSLSSAGGYGSTVTLTQTAGAVNNAVVYVRSSASAPAGNISGNVALTSTGATTQTIVVTGTVNALPTVSAVANQQVSNSAPTAAVNFTGTSGTYSWVNDTPGIGLAANGTGNISSFNAINTGSSPVTATITVTPVPTGFAYIANAGSNNVSVINTTTNAVVATIPVGIQPYGVSVSPDGSSVYVGNKTSNTVSVISTASNTVTATIPVGAAPGGLAVSPDGSTVYVANLDDGTVSVINTFTKAVSAIQVGNQPTGVAISPDGSHVYVTNYKDGTVSVINTSTNTVTATVTIGPNPTGITVSPDGTQFYVVSDFSNGAVTFLRTANNAITANVTFTADYGFEIEPAGLTVSPDGNYLYAPLPNGYGVQIIYTGHKGGSPGVLTFTSIPFSSPYGVSELADGSEYFAVDSQNGVVDVVNVTDANIGNGLAVTGAIGVGKNPESFGNFITNGTGCTGAPIKFTITVSPGAAVPPAITATAVTGIISACAGTASVSPQIQQFTVSGISLTSNITATAPAGFEISLTPGSGYGNSLTINVSAGVVNSTVVYVRAAASAPTGVIYGTVFLTVANAATQEVAVNGFVNALPTVNNPGNQNVNNGAPTTAVNFTGTGNTFNWVNDTPGIGLAASGLGNIASFTAANTSSSAVTATITVTPVNAGFAYVANNSSNILSVINTATNTVVATIPGLSSVYGVTASPDGSRVYVTNAGSNLVSVINTATNTVVSTIAVGSVPHGISVSQDGSTLYVANYGSNTVSVINTATNAVVATVAVGSNPQGISVSQDGSHVYVANFGSNTVSVINTANDVVLTVAVGTNPTGILISSDGTLYVTNQGSNTVSVINSATYAVTATIPAGTNPAGVSLSPDGTRLYVANYISSGTVTVINTATNAITATIGVGSYPYGISADPDGSQVYVTNISSGTVSVINTTSNAVTGVAVGTGAASFGNFITPGTGCSGITTTFTITVNPAPALPPAISVNPATGSISACAGTASASPELQQFTVSGLNLTGNITATAPTGFEISFIAASGYGSSVTIPQTSGTVSSTIIYVRSAASDPIGPISGSINLTSAGATIQTVAVTGVVNALPTVNTITSQTVNNGAPTTAINFTGTGNTFNWVNDTPGIGLAASGTGDIASFTAVNTGSSPVKATITATPTASGYAYIANNGAGTVSVINTATNSVIASIVVGQSPIGVSVSPDGTRAYVTNNSSINTVSVINTITNTVVSTITVGSYPSGIIVSPDGSSVYVANTLSDNVSVINTATNTVVSTITVGSEPIGISISPDGSLVYVANNYSNTISVISVATNTVISTIQVSSAFNLLVSPDGGQLYVTNVDNKTVSVIDTKTNAVEATIPVGSAPSGLSVSPDGKWLYVANFMSGNVSVINTSAVQVVSTISTGTSPAGVSLNSDGSRIYVTNDGSNDVSVIDAANNKVVATINVGQVPTSYGNFITKGIGCTGTSTTFTITVNPVPALPPAISVNPVTGSISACAGTASASPQLQQILVSGSNLTTDITATAPVNFEISLSATGGFGNSLTLTQSGGTVNNTVIYVRSAASAPTGSISGNVTITSAGASTVSPGVTATVNALPILNLVSNQTFANGTLTTGVTFTGTATNISWINDTPGIGLAASGNGNIAPFTAINTGSSPVVAKITATPEPVGFAYVVNANSNNVSVVNTATNKIVTTIPVGHDPQAVAVSPDGSKVYVANNNDNTISVINTATNAVTSTFSVGVAPAGYPYGLAVSPDGSKLYVANQQSNEVAIVNTATKVVASTIAVGVHPEGIAVTPDGSTVYVANNGGNSVSVINTGTNSVVSTIPVGNIPNEIAISPDGSKVYVTSQTSLAVIDTKTNSVITTVQAPGGDLLGITISPDGNWVYVVNSGLNNVLVINASTNAIASTISVGYNPQGLSITPDGSQLFVTKGNSNNVDVINTATGVVTSTIAVGSNPISLGNFIMGTGCPGAPVSFTITVDPSATPAIITATGSPSPLNTIYGTPSTSTIFNVSGVNMTGGILATPPAGFELSTNDINFSSTITVGSSGTIAAATIYIRLASSTPVGHYSGNIVLSSTGAPNVNVAMPPSTVIPADLTITADNKSKIVGEANPVLTVTYNGFVNNDGPAKLTTQPVIITTAVITSPVGQYPITVSGATSPNYNIAFIQGTLTISPVPLMVVIPNTFTPNGDGINDTWDIKNLEMYPACTVQIFNRYGENIYTSNGYGTPWNGTYRGAALPTSTYYYIINLKNGSKILSGFVAIIR